MSSESSAAITNNRQSSHYFEIVPLSAQSTLTKVTNVFIGLFFLGSAGLALAAYFCQFPPYGIWTAGACSVASLSLFIFHNCRTVPPIVLPKIDPNPEENLLLGIVGSRASKHGPITGGSLVLPEDLSQIEKALENPALFDAYGKELLDLALKSGNAAAVSTLAKQFKNNEPTNEILEEVLETAFLLPSKDSCISLIDLLTAGQRLHFLQGRGLALIEEYPDLFRNLFNDYFCKPEDPQFYQKCLEIFTAHYLSIVGKGPFYTYIQDVLAKEGVFPIPEAYINKLKQFDTSKIDQNEMIRLRDFQNLIDLEVVWAYERSSDVHKQIIQSLEPVFDVYLWIKLQDSKLSTSSSLKQTKTLLKKHINNAQRSSFLKKFALLFCDDSYYGNKAFIEYFFSPGDDSFKQECLDFFIDNYLNDGTHLEMLNELATKLLPGGQEKTISKKYIDVVLNKTQKSDLLSQRLNKLHHWHYYNGVFKNDAALKALEPILPDLVCIFAHNDILKQSIPKMIETFSEKNVIDFLNELSTNYFVPKYKPLFSYLSNVYAVIDSSKNLPFKEDCLNILMTQFLENDLHAEWVEKLIKGGVSPLSKTYFNTLRFFNPHEMQQASSGKMARLIGLHRCIIDNVNLNNINLSPDDKRFTLDSLCHFLRLSLCQFPTFCETFLLKVLAENRMYFLENFGVRDIEKEAVANNGTPILDFVLKNFIKTGEAEGYFTQLRSQCVKKGGQGAFKRIMDAIDDVSPKKVDILNPSNPQTPAKKLGWAEKAAAAAAGINKKKSVPTTKSSSKNGDT